MWSYQFVVNFFCCLLTGKMQKYNMCNLRWLQNFSFFLTNEKALCSLHCNIAFRLGFSFKHVFLKIGWISLRITVFWKLPRIIFPSVFCTKLSTEFANSWFMAKNAKFKFGMVFLTLLVFWGGFSLKCNVLIQAEEVKQEHKFSIT